jgi:hypothetical protein
MEHRQRTDSHMARFARGGGRLPHLRPVARRHADGFRRITLLASASCCEQPGNEEDLAGHPFAGPAGRRLDRALEEAGIDRARLPHQRGEAFQMGAARQAAHPRQAQRGGDCRFGRAARRRDVPRPCERGGSDRGRSGDATGTLLQPRGGRPVGLQRVFSISGSSARNTVAATWRAPPALGCRPSGCISAGCPATPSRIKGIRGRL